MKRFLSEATEAIRIALEQVNHHRMRSILTALGVIIGVIAVTMMGTAIKGIDIGFQNSLNMLGSDNFYVERWPWKDVGDDWMKYVNRPFMQAKYADELNVIIASTPDSTLELAVPSTASRQNFEYKDRKIDRVLLFGTTSDAPFLDTADVEFGRYFTETESASGSNVIVLGQEIAKTLFPDGSEKAIDKYIRIRSIKYKVVGVYEKQGSFLGMQSFDRNGSIPLRSLRKFFVNRHWDSTTIRVKKKKDASVDDARDEITGAMRRVRGLKPGEEDDFEVNMSDAIEEQLGPVKKGLAIAGFAVTGLALFVGAIGIMNITFVSVKERTKEIGTRRAIGARRRSILIQFLVEASMICLIGGVIGLVCSFALKTVFSKLAPNFPMVMSNDLILLAVGISIATGIVSGFAPAFMASRLDPAEALRHE